MRRNCKRCGLHHIIGDALRIALSVAAVVFPTVLSAEAGEELLVKAGAAGRPVLIREHAAWNGDCMAVPYPAVRLDRPPRNGAVCARVASVTVRTMYVGTESQCIGRVVQGLRLIYFPRPGFAGDDRLQYSVQYPSVRRSMAVRIEVGAEEVAVPAATVGAGPEAGQRPGPVPPCAPPVS